MSHDIETLIRDHYQAVDQRQHPVDRDEVTHRAPAGSWEPSPLRRHQGPLVALAAAAGVLILLGGLTWLLSPPSEVADTGRAPPAASNIDMRIDQILDDFLGAAVDYDEEKFASLITDNFVGYRIDRSHRTVETYDWIYPSTIYRPVRLGDPIVVGDGPWVVSQAVKIDWEGVSSLMARPSQGVFTLTIVDDAGVLRIAGVVEVTIETAPGP